MNKHEPFSSKKSSAWKGNNPSKKVETPKVSSPPKLQASPLSSDGNSFPSLGDAVKQTPTKRELRNRHLITPSSSDQVVHTLPSGLETVKQRLDLSLTSDRHETTTKEPDSSSPSVNGLDTMTTKSDLLPSDRHETKMHKPDLSSLCDDGPDLCTPPKTVMQRPESSSPSYGHEATTQEGDLASRSTGLQTMTIKKEWSPSDDGLATFTEAQIDFLKSHHRILPDDVFERYKYKKRLPIFTQLCLDDNPPQTKPQEDQSKKPSR